MIGKTIAEISPGDSAELVRRVEEDDIAGYIAPGIFTARLIPAVIGTRLPGPGALGRARHISSPPLMESSAPVM
jgi:hypothetical protein